MFSFEVTCAALSSVTVDPLADGFGRTPELPEDRLLCLTWDVSTLFVKSTKAAVKSSILHCKVIVVSLCLLHNNPATKHVMMSVSKTGTRTGHMTAET